jgi:Lrp/AsnC family transcriptional regulator, leucine-responsive regulatory protein
MRTIGRSRRGPSPGAIARPGATGVPRAIRGRSAARLPIYDGAVLDDRDLDIVAALQADARATYADVAGRVGLSASAVHDRVRKLEQHGVIRGYTAEISPESLGLFVTALVAASPLDPRQPDDLPDRVAEFPEVEDCYSVAGEMNYVLKVRTGTTAELEDLIRRLREKAQVATRTTIALSIPFEGRPLHTRARAEGRHQDGR